MQSNQGLLLVSIYASDKTYNTTCVTDKDSDQPVHPRSMARVLVYSSLNSLETVEGTYAGLSESSLVAQVLLLVLLCSQRVGGGGGSKFFPFGVDPFPEQF